MPVDIEERTVRRPAAARLCATDGMPLYATIVGPRCPVCGAATPR